MLQEILKNELLPQVQKPGQYLGIEWGAWNKDWDQAKSRMAIIYPDLYELGMSNFGIKILYNIVNRHPDYLCDRAYAPMADMEKLLRTKNLPLWGWESYKPLNEFDFLGFSLAYELCYNGVLTILDLAKIPFQAKDRLHSHPLIFAGGPAVFNPEIMAEYIDFYLVGDGEELIIEIQDSLLKTRKNFTKVILTEADSKALREQILLDLSQIQGIYVPRFYQPDPEQNYLPKPTRNDVPYPIKKRVTQILDDFNQPISGPMPYINTVQDKQVLEIRRGCDRGCRFCQVGYTYLPVRERSPEDLLRLSKESVKASGYEDFTLLSLSASDYTCLTEAAKAINNEHAAMGVSLSMPSQRADRFNLGLAAEISQVRKSGMTFAPEAGSEKLRKIINKGLSEEDIKNAIGNAYKEGWSHIKLYFMIGLPFETDEDLDGILDILTWSENMAYQTRKTNKEKYKKPIEITCTISTFVPKSFTAFQWFSQCSYEEFKRKQEYLMNGLKARRLNRNVKLNCTDPGIALIEAVLSRGDRRWAKVVEDLWQSGTRFDSWAENFNLERWQESAEKFSLDIYDEATRIREPGSKQPWDVLSIGFTDKFLVHEWKLAEEAGLNPTEDSLTKAETEACTENKCHACGVCFNLDVKNIVTTNRSQANPFVTEIDIEKRKESCANFLEKLEEDRPKINSKDSGPMVIVKNIIPKEKIRLKITKLGDLRFISHLDFQRLIERAIRRAGLPIVHTTGYNQRMKITWATALPLFIESEGEYLEIDLAENFDNLKQILNQELPKEARIVEVVSVTPGEKLSTKKISEIVYQARFLGVRADEDFTNKAISQQDIDNFICQDKIKSMKLLDKGLIELTLEGTTRPDSVLNTFIPESIWSIRKTAQSFA